MIVQAPGDCYPKIRVESGMKAGLDDNQYMLTFHSNAGIVRSRGTYTLEEVLVLCVSMSGLCVGSDDHEFMQLYAHKLDEFLTQEETLS